MFCSWRRAHPPSVSVLQEINTYAMICNALTTPKIRTSANSADLDDTCLHGMLLLGSFRAYTVWVYRSTEMNLALLFLGSFHMSVQKVLPHQLMLI